MRTGAVSSPVIHSASARPSQASEAHALMESNTHIGKIVLSGPVNDRTVRLKRTDASKLIAGNWKMHGSLAANAELADRHAGGAPASPPVTWPCACLPCYLYAGRWRAWGRSGAGVRRTCRHTSRAPTPARCRRHAATTSACRYAIVGPFGAPRSTTAESDATGRGQGARLRWRSGVTPIVCVGETLAEREAGQTEAGGQAPAGGGDPHAGALRAARWWWPMSPCGPSAPARPPRPSRRRRCTQCCARSCRRPRRTPSA
jgi:hypothetical protein